MRGGFRAIYGLFMVAALFALLGSPDAKAADWPMYRGSANRAAHATEPLQLPLVRLWTHADAHAPQPAWPTSRRMQFDRAIQPVSLGDRVVMGSTVDGTVFALDARNGRVVWRFFTEGPIRFAPALWQDRAFVASDDGHLYALRLEDGALLWKHRGGPSNALVLGNQRMISKWPMRGGPVVAEGVVYCAAGIWPSDGIYLLALDADTGDVVWENSDSGSLYMPQPHGGANAKSGVSAQGYLVVSGDQLFVPTGRAVPACFDLRTGELNYFHLQKYGHNGESLAMVVNGVLLNGGVGFGANDGHQLSKLGAGPIAATQDGIVRASGGKVLQYRWSDEEKPDRKGQPKATRSLKPVGSIDAPVQECAAIITAGAQVVLGGRDALCIVDLESKEVVWQTRVDGVVHGLVVADGQLVVSTDQGTVHCYNANPLEQAEDLLSLVESSKFESRSIDPVMAEMIVDRTGVSRGYCLDLGFWDGRVSPEIVKQTELHLIAVDPDPENVSALRQKMFRDGLLGARVTVLQRDLADTGLPSYFADLVMSERSFWREELGEKIHQEANRLLRPCGGKMCWSGTQLVVTERGALPGSGDWTHQYADPANTVNSEDQLVKGRLSVLWFRDLDFLVPSRHGRAPAPLMSNGRVYHEGMNGLVAVDAYNGRELWRYDIPNVLQAYDGDELMGVAGTGSNFCVGGDSVYVRDGDRCLRLDAANGSLIGEFSTPAAKDGVVATERPWGYIAWVDGILYGSTSDPRHVVTYRYVNRGGDMTRQLTESTNLFAINTRTGEQLWCYQASDSIRHNSIALAAGKVFIIDRPMAIFDRQKKPTSKEHPKGKLLALDGRTGVTLWENQEDIYGTMLAVSARHDVILMSYQPTRFRLDSEVGGRMTGLRAESGERLWDLEARYDSRPTLIDRTIYVQGGAWDLLTGKPVPFEFSRSYGCGILAGAQSMLLFRSATLGYYDLTGARETVDYGGIRPGCWINVLPAGGLVLMPDATAGCECSYLNKAWIALEPTR